MKRSPSVRSAREGFDRGNRLAARAILSDMAKYGGPESLMVQWAKAVIESAQPTIKGPLFKTAGRRAA
jgi:hypothetical protein